MKNIEKTSVRFVRGAVVACLFTLISLLQAQQFSGHYPAGVEGIKAASLPPPGFYLRDYNFVYFADRNKNGPPDFDLTAYINAPRAIWISDCKIFGANYGLDLIVPFYYSDVEFTTPGGPVRDDAFGLWDIQFEPLLLAWHFKQFDLAAGYAFWAPSGDSNHDVTRPARLAKGFWSNMFTAGGTWFPTEDKTWAVSLLNRYEIHTENSDFKLTPGDSYTLEWGLSKSVRQTVDIGVIGYYQQQINNDRGAGVAALAAAGPYNPRIHDRVVGLGPEINMFCPKMGLFVSARYAREFAAEDRPEGNAFVLTLTKRF